MKVRYSMETTPVEENCVGVGHPNQKVLTQIECQVYMNMLYRKHSRRAQGISFVITKNPYDCELGYYLSVDIVYDDSQENQEKSACNIMDNMLQKWDEIALQELRSFPEYLHWMADPKTPYEDSIGQPQISPELKAAREVIEKAGGVVILDEPEVNIYPEDQPKIKTYKPLSQLAAENGMDSTDYILEHGLDDMVPACCIYGCEVEAGWNLSAW